MNSKIPRFKQVRTKLNLSQQEFADYLTDKCHIKTAKATIGRYEAGIVYPSNRSLKKYANALGVSVFYLAGNGPTEEEVPDKIVKVLKDVYFQQNTNAEYELKNNIQLWINFYQQQQLAAAYEKGDGRLVKELIAKNNSEDKTDSTFWETYFSFLLTDDVLKNNLVGTTDAEFLKLINTAISTHFNDENLSNTLDVLVEEVNSLARKVTNLVSSVRDKETSNEELLQTINQSIKLLEKLKESIEKSNDN